MSGRSDDRDRQEVVSHRLPVRKTTVATALGRPLWHAMCLCEDTGTWTCPMVPVPAWQ
jgi:hypothetical protein